MEQLNRIRIVLAALALVLVATPVTAQTQYDVEMRIETALKYPTDRPVVVSVLAQAFEGAKPLREPVTITLQVRNVSSREIVAERELVVSAGEIAYITIGQLNVSDVAYEVTAIGSQGTKTSEEQRQRFRVYPPPQEYEVAWLSGERIRFIPTEEVDLTIREWIDHGLQKEHVRTLQLVGNSKLELDVPQGYRRVLYDVEDAHTWRNYQRARSGETADGLPYEWEFGDVRRVEPYASLWSVEALVLRSIGAGLIGLVFVLSLSNGLARVLEARAHRPLSARRRRRRRAQEELEDERA